MVTQCLVLFVLAHMYMLPNSTIKITEIHIIFPAAVGRRGAFLTSSGISKLIISGISNFISMSNKIEWYIKVVNNNFQIKLEIYYSETR